MKIFVAPAIVIAIPLAGIIDPVQSFTTTQFNHCLKRNGRTETITYLTMEKKDEKEDDHSDIVRESFLTGSRRAFFSASSILTSASILAVNSFQSEIAFAMPLVTVAEFETILKDSAKSIQSVQFSGPKSETAVVKLVDGTIFGISDLYESPTDPRSPLKLAATCRSYTVPTKFIGLEQAVLELSSSGSKKKKVYMNKRVQEAAEKEKEKKERMARDEAERLEELERMNVSLTTTDTS